MDALSKFTTPGITFLLILVFGFWLSKVGKPYNGILFNIHKLLALGTVVLASVQVYEALKAVQHRTLTILLIVDVAICVVALFVSGAFMSIGKLNYQTLKSIHKLGAVVMVIAIILTVSLNQRF